MEKLYRYRFYVSDVLYHEKLFSDSDSDQAWLEHFRREAARPNYLTTDVRVEIDTFVLTGETEVIRPENA